MKKVLPAILIVLVIIGLVILLKPKKTEVVINNQTFEVEIAKTEAERAYGLMNRDHLDHNKGMLFVFDKPDFYIFWMKNTKIPLDIIWIQDNRIVDIATLQPQTANNIPQYQPKQKANLVLELNANSDFKIGDKVEIKK